MGQERFADVVERFTGVGAGEPLPPPPELPRAGHEPGRAEDRPDAARRGLQAKQAGDTITARVDVLEVLTERNRARLQTVCVNQRGEEVLSGEAWVMPSRARPGGAPLGRARHISSPPLIESSAPVM
jgi:hypothetical protein